MKLFFRRGRTRLGNGFRPALVRYGQKRPSAVAEPKIDLESLSKNELKKFLKANGQSNLSGLTKDELLVLAKTV